MVHLLFPITKSPLNSIISVAKYSKTLVKNTLALFLDFKPTRFYTSFAIALVGKI